MQLCAGGPSAGRAGFDRRRLVLLLLLYGALPWLGYQLLTALHVPAVTALCLLAAIPALGILVQWVRSRRLNVLGALSLATILLGVAGVLITGSPAVLLARGSVVTGALGLACLVSATGVGRPPPPPTPRSARARPRRP